MKITISVAGRFHAFYLARELLMRGYLERLITSYPKFEVAKYGIPRNLVRSVLIKEVMQRGWDRLAPGIVKRRFNSSYLIAEVYDYWAQTLLPATDILIGWSNKSLHTLHKAKKRGAMVILERGSSHIEYQNSILKEEFERWGGEFHNPIHPRILEKELTEYEEADYIEVPSSFARRSFLEKGFSPEKIIQGQRGVDVSQFGPTAKEDDAFRVIYAGGMSLQKGTHYLLEAFSSLKLKNAELLLVGSLSDEMRPFFKKYEGAYRWVGHIPQPELYKYYSQGSVFVMPSLQEGFAVVQLQAMACGLPLICTTNTGGEDVVEEGKSGYVVPIRDPRALAEKIAHLYENPDLCREMGDAASERARRFTWDHYGDRIIPIYERLLRDFKRR